MKQTNEKPAARKEPPALTIKAREDQMIAYADEEAEKRIRSGKASDSLLLHYLKLGTSKNELEKAKLEQETELAKAKVESLKQAEETKAMYEEAIKAMRIYSGNGDDEDYDD